LIDGLKHNDKKEVKVSKGLIIKNQNDRSNVNHKASKLTLNDQLSATLSFKHDNNDVNNDDTGAAYYDNSSMPIDSSQDQHVFGLHQTAAIDSNKRDHATSDPFQSNFEQLDEKLFNNVDKKKPIDDFITPSADHKDLDQSNLPPYTDVDNARDQLSFDLDDDVDQVKPDVPSKHVGENDYKTVLKSTNDYESNYDSILSPGNDDFDSDRLNDRISKPLTDSLSSSDYETDNDQDRENYESPYFMSFDMSRTNKEPQNEPNYLVSQGLSENLENAKVSKPQLKTTYGDYDAIDLRQSVPTLTNGNGAFKPISTSVNGFNVEYLINDQVDSNLPTDSYSNFDQGVHHVEISPAIQDEPFVLTTTSSPPSLPSKSQVPTNRIHAHHASSRANTPTKATAARTELSTRKRKNRVNSFAPNVHFQPLPLTTEAPLSSEELYQRNLPINSFSSHERHASGEPASAIEVIPTTPAPILLPLPPPRPQARPQTSSRPQSGPRPQPRFRPQPYLKPQSQEQPPTPVEFQPQLQPLAPLQPQPQLEPQPQHQPQPFLEPNLQPDLETNLQPHLEPSLQPHLEPESQLEPQPQPQPQPHLEPEPQLEPQPPLEPQSQPQPQSYFHRPPHSRSRSRVTHSRRPSHLSSIQPPPLATVLGELKPSVTNPSARRRNRQPTINFAPVSVPISNNNLDLNPPEQPITSSEENNNLEFNNEEIGPVIEEVSNFNTEEEVPMTTPPPQPRPHRVHHAGFRNSRTHNVVANNEEYYLPRERDVVNFYRPSRFGEGNDHERTLRSFIRPDNVPVNSIRARNDNRASRSRVRSRSRVSSTSGLLVNRINEGSNLISREDNVILTTTPSPVITERERVEIVNDLQPTTLPITNEPEAPTTPLPLVHEEVVENESPPMDIFSFPTSSTPPPELRPVGGVFLRHPVNNLVTISRVNSIEAPEEILNTHTTPLVPVRTVSRKNTTQPLLSRLSIPSFSHISNDLRELIEANKKKVEITDSCLRCICEASRGCSQNVTCIQFLGVEYCGPYQITQRYWLIANQKAHNGLSFEECAANLDCARETVTRYMEMRGQDCNKDESIDCLDFATLHFGRTERCLQASVHQSLFWKEFEKCFGFEIR